jgi:hypothetical protein
MPEAQQLPNRSWKFFKARPLHCHYQESDLHQGGHSHFHIFLADLEAGHLLDIHSFVFSLGRDHVDRSRDWTFALDLDDCYMEAGCHTPPMELDATVGALCSHHIHYLEMKAVFDDLTSRCGRQAHFAAEAAIVGVDSSSKTHSAFAEVLSPGMKAVLIMLDVVDLAVMRLEIMARVEVDLKRMH